MFSLNLPGKLWGRKYLQRGSFPESTAPPKKKKSVIHLICVQLLLLLFKCVTPVGKTTEAMCLFAASKNLSFHHETINTLKEHFGRTSMELSLNLLDLLSRKYELIIG